MNVLAIGAHFDDVELGCGGAIAKDVQNGHRVFVYVATLSGFKDFNKKPIRTDSIAFEEGKRAIETLGAELVRGKFNTFEVEFNEELNRDILRVVEEHCIDKTYIHWYGDIHHDHQAVARASLHSCRHVPRMLMYRSNWYHSPSDFKENYYVDVSDQWQVKEAAIRQHQSEMDRTGHKWIEFFKNEAANAGQRIGVKYAEVFEVVKWLES